MYLRESTIWKDEVEVLVFIESLQNLFDVLNRGLPNLCETPPLITSDSTSGLKPIGLTVLGSSIVKIEAKSKLNVEYIEIDPNL